MRCVYLTTPLKTKGINSKLDGGIGDVIFCNCYTRSDRRTQAAFIYTKLVLHGSTDKRSNNSRPLRQDMGYLVYWVQY